MKFPIVLFCVIFVTVSSENSKWVFKDDAQDKSDKSRYQVYENLQDSTNNRPVIGFRPQNGPYRPNGRPIGPVYPGNNGVLVGPGGPSGSINRPLYPGGNEGGFESGYVPPWIRDDPRYRDYDTCRCRYSFNCPSVGLKFGACGKDKKYCCFSSRKYPALVSEQTGGGQYPTYQGPPNKYGPISFTQGPNYYRPQRPQGNYNGGNRYPNGNYQFSGAKPNYPRPYGNPYDQSYDYDDYDGYSRSANSNETEAASSEYAA